MSLKDSINSEIDKISQMDRSKKWDYFKTYYLKWTIGIVVVLIMLIWFVKDTMFQKYPASMGCAYNVELSEEQIYKLTDGYIDYMGLSPKKAWAGLSVDDMFEGTAQEMDARSHEMALFAQIAAGEIYYLILDRDTLELYENGGIYAYLDEVLPEAVVDEMEDVTVSVKDEETGAERPLAIDLQKLGFIDGEGFLAYTIAKPDDEYPLRFINYLEEVSKAKVQ